MAIARAFLRGGLIFAAVLAVMALLGIEGYQQRVETVKPFPVDCLEGWAHRGYVNAAEGIKENTLASYEAAIARGAPGIEIDALYDVDLGEFIVSHDAPYHRREDGSLLTLGEVLQQFPQVNVWLDAKNLSSLWPWEAAAAIDRLDDLLSREQRKQRVLVESRSPFVLRQLGKSGIYTALLVSPNPRHDAVSLWAVILASKLSFAIANPSGLSMSHGRYRDDVAKAFAQAPMYLSTVNDPQKAEQYQSQVRIKVFLTDNPALYGRHCSSD